MTNFVMTNIGNNDRDRKKNPRNSCFKGSENKAACEHDQYRSDAFESNRNGGANAY